MMREMQPATSDLSEVVSVKSVELLETQTCRRYSLSASHTSSSRSGFNVKTFLKRNAYVIFTMAGVILGEWKNGIFILHYA